MQFKGKNHEELDLLLLYEGRRQKAEEQVEVYEIPYRDMEPSVHTGKYKPYFREMEFLIIDRTKRSLIYQWLNGYGKLSTVTDPGGYFKAEIIQAIESGKFEGLYDNMLVSFKINPPFFYLDSGDVPIVMTAPGTINNPGTHTSDPYIRIIGSGNITVTINGRKMTFTNVETFIDIDTEVLPPIYKNNENQGHKMVGDLPYFDVGANAITWTGAVTELNILPRWREL